MGSPTSKQLLKEVIKERNEPISTLGNSYRKKVATYQRVKTLETIITAAKSPRKNILMDLPEQSSELQDMVNVLTMLTVRDEIKE